MGKEEILAQLTVKGDTYACALSERMIAESGETNVWYDCLSRFAALLGHPKSLQ